jgi:hypothetical protein
MKNIYRIDDNGNWGNYYKVEFPDGQIMDEDNHDFERDGFFWSKTPPKKYLEWIELNNHLE